MKLINLKPIEIAPTMIFIYIFFSIFFQGVSLKGHWILNYTDPGPQYFIVGLQTLGTFVKSLLDFAN